MKGNFAGALLLTLSLLPGLAAGQAEFSTSTVPHLQVRGDIELQVPADQLRVSIGVVTQAETARTALDQNSGAMKRVEETLRRQGLEIHEFRTGHFGINPVWSRPLRAERPAIIGFTVTNSFMVTTTKLELAGVLIEKGVQAGANAIGELVFGLADPATHRAEAIRQATSQARMEARSLASAASLTLEEILAISLDQAAITPQRLQAMRMEVMSDQPPLAPGEVTVRAGVAITYRIGSTPTDELAESKFLTRESTGETRKD
jgi:uncharacterized protein